MACAPYARAQRAPSRSAAGAFSPHHGSLALSLLRNAIRAARFCRHLLLRRRAHTYSLLPPLHDAPTTYNIPRAIYLLYSPFPFLPHPIPHTLPPPACLPSVTFSPSPMPSPCLYTLPLVHTLYFLLIPPPTTPPPPPVLTTTVTVTSHWTLGHGMAVWALWCRQAFCLCLTQALTAFRGGHFGLVTLVGVLMCLLPLVVPAHSVTCENGILAGPGDSGEEAVLPCALF